MRIACLVKMGGWGCRLQWRWLPGGCGWLDEASDGVVCDGGGGACVPGQRVQRGWTAGGCGGERMEARAEGVVVEK